jgi:hypothetical protein
MPQNEKAPRVGAFSVPSPSAALESNSFLDRFQKTLESFAFASAPKTFAAARIFIVGDERFLNAAPRFTSSSTINHRDFLPWDRFWLKLPAIKY